MQLITCLQYKGCDASNILHHHHNAVHLFPSIMRSYRGSSAYLCPHIALAPNGILVVQYSRYLSNLIFGLGIIAVKSVFLVYQLNNYNYDVEVIMANIHH